MLWFRCSCVFCVVFGLGVYTIVDFIYDSQQTSNALYSLYIWNKKKTLLYSMSLYIRHNSLFLLDSYTCKGMQYNQIYDSGIYWLLITITAANMVWFIFQVNLWSLYFRKMSIQTLKCILKWHWIVYIMMNLRKIHCFKSKLY